MNDLLEQSQQLFPQFEPWLAKVDTEKAIPKIILNVLEITDSDLYSKLMQYCDDNNIDFEYNTAVSTRILNNCMSPLANMSIETLSDFDNTFLLDPYNPRISTSSFDSLNEADITDFINAQEECRKNLDSDSQGICTSIQTAGYQRGNSIKVVSLTGHGGPYVVLEGNTRMNAIRNLIKSGDQSLLFDFSDVDICEMSGFSYRTFYPLKLEMLKTIHIAGVKPWGAYKQARVLQLSRDRILKDQPDLADPKKQTRLVNLIRNGSRLSPSEVKHALAAIDLMDKSVELVNSDYNIDGYVLVDTAEFEDKYSYFETGVTHTNVNNLILQNDDTLWGFLIQSGIIYLPFSSKTAKKTIGRAENIREIEKMLKNSDVPENWSEEDTPKETILIPFTNPDEGINVDETLSLYKASKGKQKPIDLKQLKSNLKTKVSPGAYDDSDIQDALDNLIDIIDYSIDDIIMIATAKSANADLGKITSAFTDLSTKINDKSKIISLLSSQQ